MTEKRQPWMKFYPTDWRGDAGLRGCSYAARGLWMDLMSLMHEATPYGHLLVNDKSPTPKRISAMLGGSEREVTGLLKELEDEGVFSRTDEGVIFSRRMVADNAKAERDRENGKGGGNPHLKRKSGKLVNGGVNPPANPEVNSGDNGGDKARATHVPDARYQIEPLTTFEAAAQDRMQTGTNADDSRNPPEIPNLLPEDPSQTLEQTAKKALFSEGLRIIHGLLKGDETAARSKLGKLRKAASDNDLLLLDVLRQAGKLQPADPFPWLIAALKTKKQQENTAKSVKSVWKDGSDNQGIYAWLSREIDVVDTPGDDIWRSCIGGFYADCIAEEIVTILELPAGWRGDWSALGRWLREDIEPATIFETLRQAASRGLPNIASMQFFDTAVRQNARRAA